MSALKDLTGQVFGYLLVVARAPAARGTKWWCLCRRCGSSDPVPINSAKIRRGDTKSCGCLHRDATREANRARSKERTIDTNGYVRIRVEGRRVLEHRYVMASALGRPLLRTETIHHRNGDRADNRLSNLEIWSSRHPGGQRHSDVLRQAFETIADVLPSLSDDEHLAFLGAELWERRAIIEAAR